MIKISTLFFNIRKANVHFVVVVVVVVVVVKLACSADEEWIINVA